MDSPLKLSGLSGEESLNQVMERVTRLSRFARDLINARGSLRDDLGRHIEVSFDFRRMQACLADARIRDEITLKAALRRLRRRVMLRLIARDLSGRATAAEVMTTASALADVTLSTAQTSLTEWLEKEYGAPVGSESGTRQELIVVGMGKLGGHELNVSSDIDLVFVYPEDGETRGPRVISNQELFTLLGKKLIGVMQEVTGDGFVFRVDMRLRPYGEGGALASSLAMLENYLITQGRPWERFAWIKARAVTGTGVRSLMAIVHPFVFRRYLDFAAIGSLRDLHRQIREDVKRRDRLDNIKLGPGGIREIEFIAQVFQLIRGGRNASLQIRPTLEVLGRLSDLNLLPERAVKELKAAYLFLRNLEHRLQYLDDRQTHTLPGNAQDQQLIAESMQFPDYRALEETLDAHRANVTRHFEAVFGAHPHRTHHLSPVWQNTATDEEAMNELASLGYESPRDALRSLRTLRGGAFYRQIPDTSRSRLDALIPLVVESAAGQPNRGQTLDRILDLLAAVSRREAYLALFAEHPQMLQKLARLASTSRWAVNYLSQHPLLLDELLGRDESRGPPDWAALRTALDVALEHAGADVERQMDALRHFKHALIFRLIAEDLEGGLSLEKLSDSLSELADVLLGNTLELVWRSLPNKHRSTPRFSVIGFGKLGGKELGYGSDLDIIFLYDDADASAQEVYARLAQRLNAWLGAYTAAGVLYQTDLRLRPDGASGLLVSSIEAFEDYQNNHAWVWEHQALTRARFCAGDRDVGEAFEQIRIHVLRRSRDLPALRSEVTRMRAKMLAEHRQTEGLFDVKNDRGGIIDVEFMVQYLVLAHSSRFPELTRDMGNIALLELGGSHGILPSGLAHDVAAAYREFRRLQHQAWLNEEGAARVDPKTVKQPIEKVLSLWSYLFS